MSPGAKTTTLPARHVPGEEGIWVFIFGDLVIFGLFFLTFLSYRADSLDIYLAAQKLLDHQLGLLNTLLLLTSSLFVAQAVRNAREGGGRHVTALLTAGILCGGGFVVVKAVEYGAKFSAGISVFTNDFFMFYFMFTGIHLLHVLIGLGVLFYLRGRSRLPAGGLPLRTLEGGGAFWHLVDLLWVVLFALLYLVK